MFAPVQEGLFLYTHNVSPYDGGVFHQVQMLESSHKRFTLTQKSQAPLLLPFFAVIPPSYFPIATKLLYIVIDLLCAYALMQIADSGQSGSSRLFTSPRKDIKWDGSSIGAA